MHIPTVAAAAAAKDRCDVQPLQHLISCPQEGHLQVGACGAGLQLLLLFLAHAVIICQKRVFAGQAF